MSNTNKIKRKHKVMAQIIDDAPLYTYSIDGGEMIVSPMRRYLVAFADRRKVWYPYNHPVVKMILKAS